MVLGYCWFAFDWRLHESIAVSAEWLADILPWTIECTLRTVIVKRGIVSTALSSAWSSHGEITAIQPALANAGRFFAVISPTRPCRWCILTATPLADDSSRDFIPSLSLSIFLFFSLLLLRVLSAADCGRQVKFTDLLNSFRGKLEARNFYSVCIFTWDSGWNQRWQTRFDRVLNYLNHVFLKFIISGTACLLSNLNEYLEF